MATHEAAHEVFVTGSTGYLGRALIKALLQRGHTVYALTRPHSIHRLVEGTIPVIGDALNADTFAHAIPPASTLVHLVGTPHPSPAKAKAFRTVDLVSIQQTVQAAQTAKIDHLIYVSIAQPAPIMQAYVKVRQEGEGLIRESGLNATILRPWYVLGPGHWWPYVLMPLYAVLKWWPSTHESAQRLDLITLRQMHEALVYAVEHPALGIEIMNVPDIKNLSA